MNQEKLWLIRSSGRIIGPLSLAETSQLLAKKIVTPIDEIRSPYRPWMFIRQHEDLMALLKFELSSKEETASGLTRDVENTQTMTVTEQTLSQSSSFSQEDVLIQAQAPNRPHEDTSRKEGQDAGEAKVSESAGSQVAKEIHQPAIKTIVAAEKTVSWSPGETADAHAKTFVYGQDPRVQSYVKKKSTQAKWFLLGFLAIVGAFAFALWAWEVKKQKDILASKYQKLDQAREYFARSQYSEAVKLYESLYSSDKNLFKLSDRLNLAALLVGAEKRLASADQVLAEIERPTQPAEWKMWMKVKYISALDKKQWDEAQFILAEMLQEQFDVELLLEQMTVAILSNDYAKVTQILGNHWNQLTQRKKDRERLSIILLRLLQTKYALDSELKNRMILFLKEESVTYSPYYIPLFSMMVAQLMSNAEPLDSLVESALSINIFEIGQFTSELLSRDYLISEEIILPQCDVIANELAKQVTRKEQQILWEDLATVIKSTCLAFYQDPEWMGVIKEARRARPQSQILAAADANLMAVLGRIPEAVATVDLCQNIPWCKLARARICLSKRMSCVDDFLEDNKMTAKSWGPFYYLFTAYLEQLKGNEFARRNAIKNGRKEYPFYKPLLDLDKL